MKLKNIALSITAASTIGGSYFIGANQENKLSPVQKIQASEKKRFVAYRKADFGKPSFQVQSNISTIAGTSIQEPLENINGFVFEANEEELQNIKGMEKQLGIKVVEDRVYKLDFFSGCSKKPDPPKPKLPVSQTIPWGVGKVQALEAQVITTGESIKVCVVDTGSDQNHPDLKGQLIGGKSFVSGNSNWQDNQGHGTHVAGTVAATINDIDVVGVSQAKIYTVKALDYSGSGMGSWIAKGIVDCVNQGTKLISMSLGSPASRGPDELIADAIEYAHSKGIKTVCAAGNDSGQVGWPAQGCTYAVSATDSNDRLASFSSRGATIDIAAPGVDVLSLRNGGGVVSFSGTSMATPHVAGALALALEAGKELRGDDIGLPKEYQGHIGRLNVYKTLTE